MINIPSHQELQSAAAAHDRDWGGVYDVLREYCRAHPGHTSGREVTAKVALIDRAYAAGLGRQVTPPKGTQAFTVISDYVLAHGSQIDDMLARLAPFAEPCSPVNMSAIVAVHGELTTLLQEVTHARKAPRSFAAKYLHFHCPLVPIYDSYAAAELTKRVRWNAREIPFARLPAGDAEYWSFCVRFLRLDDACRAAGLQASVRDLDAFLWQSSFAR